MAKRKMQATPDRVDAYEAAMERIKAVTGARTQVQLAEVLEVRQSSISDAKRRASIPSDWLLKIQRKHHVLADWFLTGEGPKHINDASEQIVQLQQRLALITEDFAHLVSRVENSLDIINMTTAQLEQRKAFAAGVLSVDAVRAKDLFKSLKGMAGEVSALPINH